VLPATAACWSQRPAARQGTCFLTELSWLRRLEPAEVPTSRKGTEGTVGGVAIAFRPEATRPEEAPLVQPYQSVRSRSTDFGQVGFEPEQVPTARKLAFYQGF